VTQVRYGTFTCPAGCATWRTRTRTTANDLGLPSQRTQRIEVAGQLQGADPADLFAKSRVMRAAFDRWGQDLVLTLDDGRVAESLLNGTSLGGTRVVEGVDFPDGDGADATTYRNFRFAVEATYPIASGNLLAFEEDLETRGGGPKFGFMPIVNGAPVKQMVYQATPYLATQSGTAVGLLTYPNPPPPLWPNAQLEAPVIRRSRPQIVGGVTRNYRISWAYTFGSTSPLG
jgi:hypothetical protein